MVKPIQKACFFVFTMSNVHGQIVYPSTDILLIMHKCYLARSIQRIGGIDASVQRHNVYFIINKDITGVFNAEHAYTLSYAGL